MLERIAGFLSTSARPTDLVVSEMVTLTHVSPAFEKLSSGLIAAFNRWATLSAFVVCLQEPDAGLLAIVLSQGHRALYIVALRRHRFGGDK